MNKLPRPSKVLNLEFIAYNVLGHHDTCYQGLANKNVHDHHLRKNALINIKPNYGEY